MNRLQSELHRLYLPRSPARAEPGAPSASLIDAHEQVRAMVIELTRPPSWELLARVWHGVQAELELPAPAIAVSGTDGLQLWFSLAEPIAASQAHAFLEGLRSRYLADIDPGRVGLMPAAQASLLRQPRHARPVPALQETGNWSAFVAPDLAPVFAETPWLDIPPSEEGQAALLRGLGVIKPAVFEAASKRLGPTTHRPEATAAVTPAAAGQDPTCFLRQVMNDAAVPMALRIEAAKTLLQYANDQPSAPGEDSSRSRA